MNIFAFHKCSASAAEDHCNSHVCKMTVEYAQLLSTALRHHYKVEDTQLYNCTHQHGRFVYWTAASRNNFEWLLELFIETANQYTLRYGKIHKTFLRMRQGLAFETYKYLLPRAERVAPPPLGMPDWCKIGDGTTWQSVTESNRNYFNQCKQHIARWKFERPVWYNDSATGTKEDNTQVSIRDT